MSTGRAHAFDPTGHDIEAEAERLATPGPATEVQRPDGVLACSTNSSEAGFTMNGNRELPFYLSGVAGSVE
jgi:hypothetical protein